MSSTAIIPARYASTRLPGKPLLLIDNKPMIQWVYERVSLSAFTRVVVATDDERIAEQVVAFGGEVVMTSPKHPSGTDRCGEAARLLKLHDREIVVNVQGDEPFVAPEELNLLLELLQQPQISIATLVQPITADQNPDNPNTVKVVRAKQGQALYFSRAKIPYNRDLQYAVTYYKHKGIYGYRNNILQKIVLLPEDELEQHEKLEQLRWLANGFVIHTAISLFPTISIDTQDDLEQARAKALSRNF
jgi:3-deoxy-manno-octulosonate cytidylyltransferase (CMP-KDO synthetase)